MQSKSFMRDLVITAKLKDGRIAGNNFDLMLDGILYKAFIKCYLPSLLGQMAKEFTDFELPLARHITDSGDWYHLCSRAFFESKYEELEYYNKKQDLTEAEIYLEDGKSKSDLAAMSGKYKPYRNAVVVKCTKEIKWYAHGMKTEIEKLLTYIDCIGLKHNIGYGQIDEWIVEEGKKVQFDKTMRPIPNENGNCIKTIKPPYHWYKNRRRCDYVF